MAVTTRPELLTKEAVASLTAPDAVPVKLVRAATGKEGDHHYSLLRQAELSLTELHHQSGLSRAE